MTEIQYPTLSLFLEPCEIVTLQTPCTDEEYESNEDCLPQKTDNCDHSKELYCLSGICLSNCHPQKEVYDPVEGKCFRKVGSDCRSPNNNNNNNVNDEMTAKTETSLSNQVEPHHNATTEKIDEEEHEQHRSSTKTTFSVPPCEQNSVCEQGHCSCAKSFTYDHTINKCVRYASYAGFCNDTVSCDIKSDIVCVENQCQCKSQETQYFHLKRKRCYISIDQVCSNGLQFCPDNSNCVRAGKRGGDDNCGNAINSILFTSDATSRGPRLQNDSSAKRDYRLRLLCQELTSTAEDGDEEHFIGILGNNEEEFVCKCATGYAPTWDKRFCLGLHGSRCNTLHRCNSDRGLKCVDGTCLCDRENGNEQVFSEQFQTCITRINAPCTADGKGEREEDICPIGASCKEDKCTCDDELVPLSGLPAVNVSLVAYSCMKSHGMSCKYNGNEESKNNNGSSLSSSKIVPFVFPERNPFEPPCNHEIGLACSKKDEKCLCKGQNQFFDSVASKCNRFTRIDGKIPVIHFTPPEDREYMFRSRNCAGSLFYCFKKCSIDMTFLINLIEIIVLYFIISCVLV